MILQETVCCATAPTSSGSGTGAVSLHDIHTGATLASFKQTSAGPHCTSIFESKSTGGGFILAAQPDKAILNVYSFQKDQLHLKIVLPEKLTCITLDRGGDFCAGGTAQGRIYLWELASGILFNSWDAHYRKINVLKFTNDVSALISGSEDSAVSVWSVSRLLDDAQQTELPMPYCTLSDHTLPITDIVCGVGIFPNCRIITASIDHSVKLWDLSSRSLLTTFQFPQPISHLAWDITERIIFVASTESTIYQINLFREVESKFGGTITEAVGGAGLTDIIDIENESRKRLISVRQPISALAISITGTLLLVGTMEGAIQVYDIPSHQLLRTIATHKGFQIAYMTTILKPLDLVGHVNLNFRVGNAADSKEIMPVKPIMPLQRVRDAKARDAHDVSMILPHRVNTHIDKYSTYAHEELLRDHAFFMASTTSSGATGGDSLLINAKVEELEAEISHLREQLGKAKGVNDAMWEKVVHQLVGKESTTVDAEDTGAERFRKRGRAL